MYTLKFCGLCLYFFKGWGKLFSKHWKLLSFSKYHILLHLYPKGPALMLARKGF